VVYLGLEPQSGQTEDNSVCICWLSVKHTALGERAKIGWLGVVIMCMSGRYVPVDCCVNELAL